MTDAYETVPTAADVAVGDTGPTVTEENVDRTDFVKYAGASGDFNPIHFDEPYANAAGNERVFGQGMLVAGYAAHFAADWFGLANVTSFSVRFEARLWPDETVTVTGEVTDVARHDAGATVTASLQARTGDGTALLTGEVVAELPADPAPTDEGP